MSAAQPIQEALLNESTIQTYDLETLVKMAQDANAQYRAGTPIMDDPTYDMITREIARRDPNHPFVNQVEPEDGAIEGKTVPLPERMLSTQKAYSHKEIRKWAESVIRAAEEADNIPVFFHVMPKLDGFAAYDNVNQLLTRGDGRNGTDITRAFDRGLQVAGGRGEFRFGSKGEIVVDRQYFADHLADEYENSRNVIASVIKEGELAPAIRAAVDEGAVVFYPFSRLKFRRVTLEELMDNLEVMWDEIIGMCLYDTDGLVIEAESTAVKEAMGNTNHHYRWQIAYKKNTEYRDIKVTSITWQTAKTGRITPVVELEPTRVSGVTISRATGHHAGNIMNNGIGEGAIVRVCRSGLVIPYISEVVKSVPTSWADNCPSCGSPTYLEGDNLFCSNTINCPAQIERTIEYFFKTLGNCDGFGPKVIEKLCAHGATTASGIYLHFSKEDFIDAGISAGVAQNLINELNASLSRPIEDWRFLAAFGINNVGKGGCERLLRHHKLLDVFNLTADDFMQIDGFGEKSAVVLHSTLKTIKSSFDYLYGLGFNLIETPLASEFEAIATANGTHSPIAGKTLVFTGTMESGSRDDMKAQAKLLGAKVSDSVSGKTDYLVCGTNVGANKTNAAAAKGVTVLTESEYLELIKP
jgi:DNA ligase (NAD+)